MQYAITWVTREQEHVSMQILLRESCMARESRVAMPAWPGQVVSRTVRHKKIRMDGMVCDGTTIDVSLEMS